MTDYYLPNPDELRSKFLRDIELGLNAQGIDNPAVEEGTDYYISGTAYASGTSILVAQLARLIKNSSELTATGLELDQIRSAIGLPIVPAIGATGRIFPVISGNNLITFPAGIQFTLDRNGKRGEIAGAQTILAGGSLAVRMIDTGFDSDAAAEEKLTFTNPPVNVSVSAIVDADGLTGGTDDENDERKRQRILNRRRNVPGGGNPGQLIELAESSTGSVQKAFVYPAILGPSYAKVVVTKSFQLDKSKIRDFSRELGDSSLAIIASAVLAELPSGIEITVESAQDQLFSCSIGLTLPDAQDGGFKDSIPFPALIPADNGRVTATVITSTNEITVSALGAAPVVGNKILWWSPVKKEFLEAQIVSFTGSAGSYALTLDRPLAIADEIVAIGDYISPAASNSQNYGESFLRECNKLGPGENTSSSDRLPRAKRRPFITEDWDSGLKSNQLKAMSLSNPEIQDFAWIYRSLNAPTVPALASTSPNVLVPLHFAIYNL